MGGKLSYRLCFTISFTYIYILPLKLKIYIPVHNFQRSLYIYVVMCIYIYISQCLIIVYKVPHSLSLSCTSSRLLTIPMFSLLTVVILRNDQISAPTHLRGAILTRSRTRSWSTSLFDKPGPGFRPLFLICFEVRGARPQHATERRHDENHQNFTRNLSANYYTEINSSVFPFLSWESTVVVRS